MVIFADDAGRTSGGVSVADNGIGEATSVLSAVEVVYALNAGASAITGVIDATSVGEATIIALADIRDAAVCGLKFANSECRPLPQTNLAPTSHATPDCAPHSFMQ